MCVKSASLISVERQEFLKLFWSVTPTTTNIITHILAANAMTLLLCYLSLELFSKVFFL